MTDYIPVKVKRLDGELVIGHSIPMSCFCYTIFRLDPYIGCSHSCIYCYTKFFPSLNPPKIKARISFPQAFQQAIHLLKKSHTPIPPFRLSELTDGLQPIEEKLKLSYRTLKVCLQEQVPVIISTKSTLVAKPPWLDIIKELAAEKLAIVQITLTLLDDNKARKLEPHAPPPSQRIKTIETLVDEQIPVILRLQPIIPYLNSQPDQVQQYVETAAALKVKQIIAETIRISTWKTLQQLQPLLTPHQYKKLTNPKLWQKYPKSPCKHPNKQWRTQTYQTIKQQTTKYKIHFTVCREPFHNLNTAPDCCGIYLLKNPTLRPTLYEYLHNYKKQYKYITPQHLQKTPLKQFKQKTIKHIQIAQTTAKDPKTLHKILLL